MSSQPAPSPSWSPEEAALRRDLADLYNLVDDLGWSELVFNHISARVPGAEQYLVNAFGLTFDEITPESLIKVDVHGQLVAPSQYRPNPAGFALHGVIHESRPDVTCVLHAHTHAISAVTMKPRGFSHDNFYGAQLTGRIAYHDFEGVTLRAEERPRILAALGDRTILAMRNHGIAIAERSLAAAFTQMWIVQRAAEVQLASESMAGPDIPLTDEVRTLCAGDALKLTESGDASNMIFGAAVRRMKRRRAARGY
jgi:ribulose-5-phosphate 4-epimerase/fuculose-1-phosphate aldolase